MARSSDSGRDAARRWAEELAAWAVPTEILERSPRRPHVFSPEMFAPPPQGSPLSLASRRAAESLGAGGTVLDVGCGGGAAAFAVTPPATAVFGVDRQADMLRLFAQTAAERGIPASTVLGGWPDVAEQTPTADVVVCHHVLYNAPDILPFARALHAHAGRRVVLEITERHPQVTRAPLWRHFWDLDRPAGPTAALALEALRDAGFPVRAEASTATPRDDTRTAAVEAAFWCRQLCLPPEREPDVAALLPDLPFPSERVTLWWDVC